MNLDLEFFKELYAEQSNITEAAKIYAKKQNIEYTDSLRRKFSYLLNKDSSPDNDLENETVTDTNQYIKENPLSALKPDGTIMSISEYCEHYNIPEQDVRT